MNNLGIVFSLFLLISLSGCDEFVHKQKLIDAYYLIAIDESEQMSISSSVNEDNSAFVGVIDQTVFAVGYNENFIIAKQYPRQLFQQPDRSITNYYIIDLGKVLGAKGKVYGPMTKVEFQNKRNSLNLPETLTFNIVFKDLE